MPEVDAALEVSVVGRHVLQADAIVETRSGPPYGCHDVVARLEFIDLCADGFDDAKALVAQYQVLVAGG